MNDEHILELAIEKALRGDREAFGDIYDWYVRPLFKYVLVRVGHREIAEDITEEIFIKAMRNGLHLGAGRPILPPMPFMGLAGLSDADLKSVFAYLKSIKPISNKVPDPVPPNEVAVRYGK